jgi:hypothetical protein
MGGSMGSVVGEKICRAVDRALEGRMPLILVTASGGEDALFYVNGKIAEAESADRIQRLFDRDPVAPFVAIGGRDVEPTGYPEDAAKADAEDPYQRGVGRHHQRAVQDADERGHGYGRIGHAGQHVLDDAHIRHCAHVIDRRSCRQCGRGVYH